MYANVVFVTINDLEAGQRELEEQVIPMVRGWDGFRQGFWLANRDSGEGMAVVLFDTEEAAEAAVGNIPPSGPGDTVSRDRVETFEVVGQA